MEQYSRETEWTANLVPGREVKVKIKNMNHRHLANLIHFLDTERIVRPRKDELLKVMIEEAHRRGLTTGFLAGAPYDFNKEGEYEFYDENTVPRSRTPEERIAAVIARG